MPQVPEEIFKKKDGNYHNAIVTKAAILESWESLEQTNNALQSKWEKPEKFQQQKVLQHDF